MADGFKKLNLKDQDDIVVVNSPESFEPELEALTGISVNGTYPFSATDEQTHAYSSDESGTERPDRMYLAILQKPYAFRQG
ncbi:hypothetical protein ES703_29776 [subsurface metagenome]